MRTHHYRGSTWTPMFFKELRDGAAGRHDANNEEGVIHGEQPLVKVLKEGTIKGSGIDGFENEPG